MMHLKNIINHLLKLSVVVLLSVLAYNPVFAVGTTAGVDISNTATATYTMGGTGYNINDTITFRVDEKLDVNVVWQDAVNVGVNTPDTNRVLTYLLTNTGNGTDDYLLTVDNNIGGDQFNPVFVNIYLDANDNGIYDSGTDTLYNPGGNDPSLNADESLAIFVVNDIPGSRSPGDLGNSQLTATSNTSGAVPAGTAFINAGDNTSDAVVGNSGGTSNDTGTYEVSNVNVSIVKSVVINDQLGGNQPMPGATMTYTLVVSVTGTGTASGIIITDPIPTDTTYVTNSITLNAVVQTDAADSPTDESDYNVTNANNITVNLGDMTSASPTQTITFDVIIN